MPRGDDILLGAAAPLTTDSDGDGISDAQERLDGTDPGDAADSIRRDAEMKPDLADVRGDLDRATLEREVGFDPAANMPGGMSVDSGLKGLTNLDGTDLPTGANHFGIGEDSLLTGRLGANSPLDMLKDPAVGGDGSKAGPPGAELGPRGPNLVGGEAEAPDEYELPGAIQPSETPPPPMSDPPAPPPEEDREPPPPPKPDGEDPDPVPNPTPLRTDPDAGGNGGVSVAGGTPVVIIDGPRVVEGAGGTPHIDADSPPPKEIDLVTDGGDGTVDTSTTSGAVRGAPAAPVVHTINPDAGVVQPPVGSPPPGGGGGWGDDDFGLLGVTSAATAASAEAPSGPVISLAGSGGSGIGSVAPSAPDDGVTAVNRFATEYLADDSLSTDLSPDLAPQHDQFQSPALADFSAGPLDDCAGPDGDDPLDG